MAPAVDITSPERDEELIEFVRQNPPLYALHHKHYKNKRVKKLLWREIAEKMGVEDYVVQNRWKSIRDYYVRLKKKHPTGSPAENLKPLEQKRLHCLSFLESTYIVHGMMLNNDGDQQNQRELRSLSIQYPNEVVIENSFSISSCNEMEDDPETNDHDYDPCSSNSLQTPKSIPAAKKKKPNSTEKEKVDHPETKQKLIPHEKLVEIIDRRIERRTEFLNDILAEKKSNMRLFMEFVVNILENLPENLQTEAQERLFELVIEYKKKIIEEK